MAVLVVLAGLLFATCGSGFQVVLNANLEPTSLKLNVREKGEFTPVVNAIGGYTVTWESSDPTVASVDDDGVVTAKKPGKTEITATFTDSITVTVPVEVVDPDAPGTDPDPEPDPDPDPETKPDLAINLGSTLKMAKGASREISTGDSSVTWSSGNEDVAVVRETSSSGDIATYELYGVGPGRTTITATSVDYPDVKAEMEVIVVVGPTAIVIREGEKLEAVSGSAHTLTLTVRAIAPKVDREFYDDSIVWKSSNTSVVGVDTESGELKQGSSAGTATITATAKYSHNVTDTIEVRYLSKSSGLKFVDGDSIENVPAGDTLMVAVEVTGASGDNHNWGVKWKSSDESVLRVVDTLYPEGEEMIDYSDGVNRVVYYHNYVVAVVLLASAGEAELTAISVAGDGRDTIKISVSGDAENSTLHPDSVEINGVIFDAIDNLQSLYMDGERYDGTLEKINTITLDGVSSISDNGDGSTTVEGVTMVTLIEGGESTGGLTIEETRTVYESVTVRMDGGTILLNTMVSKELTSPKAWERHQIKENALYLAYVVFPENGKDNREVPRGPTSYPHGVEWSSSDTATLEVASSDSSRGRISLKEQRERGSVVITATSTAGTKSDTVEFRVFGAPSTIEIDQGDALELFRGRTEWLSATVSGNAPFNDAVSWSSDDPGVVAIDAETGELRAVEAGTVTVTARSILDSAVSAEIAITVVAPPDTITIDGDSEIALYMGETRTLGVGLEGPDGFDRGVEWSSDESGVVTVDPATGELTARRPGTTTVTVSSTLDPGVSASITVTVENNLSGIEIKQGPTVTLYPGESSTLEVEFESTGDFDDSVSWTSEDGDVVSVDAGGKLTAGLPGTTTVKVRPLHNQELSAMVTVNVVGIVIDQGARLTVGINSRIKLTARAWVEGDPNPGIVWSLGSGKNGPGVAITADGLLSTGEQEGSISVVVRVDGSTELYDTILISVEELALLNFGFKLADNTFTPRWDPEVGDFSVPISDIGGAIEIEIPLDYKGVDFGDLVPSFETTPGAEVYVGRERQASGEDSHDFSGSAPVIYTLKKGASVRSYSIEVRLELFLVPDATFRAYLKRSFPDAFEGELLDTTAASVRTATEIDVDREKISSLAGIEFFPALEKLDCRSNSLTTLDVSGNPALEELSCSWNSLTTLDVSGNPVLKELSCSSNSLTTLDVSGNPVLEELWCYSTGITTLDVSGNPVLKELWCYENSLTTLDVSGNPALEKLYCSSNRLTTLDVSGNPALELLSCDSNSLTTLDVSGNPALEKLSCSWNSLTTLDVSGNPALEELWCSSNSLTTLDVSGNPALEKLSCNSNSLTTLDVSGNPALEVLWCTSNSLTTLDVSGNPALEQLRCYSNSLTTLDVSGNPALEVLSCFLNSLTTLDVSGNPALERLRCDRNPLTTLDLSGMTGKPEYLIINAGEVYEGKTYNPLTTLIVHEDLRNHDEIKEALRNSRAALSVTYVK